MLILQYLLGQVFKRKVDNQTTKKNTSLGGFTNSAQGEKSSPRCRDSQAKGQILASSHSRHVTFSLSPQASAVSSYSRINNMPTSKVCAGVNSHPHTAMNVLHSLSKTCVPIGHYSQPTSIQKQTEKQWEGPQRCSYFHNRKGCSQQKSSCSVMPQLGFTIA